MSNLIRARSLDGLEILGIRYDPQKNDLARTRNSESEITGEGSTVRLFVIPTDEERVMIEDTVALLEGRYDIHTRFTYTFQSKDYHNAMRDSAFDKECEKKPGLAGIVARPS